MTVALALSAWLALCALQGGPVIRARVLDAQAGDPVAGADVSERVEVRGATTPDAAVAAETRTYHAIGARRRGAERERA